MTSEQRFILGSETASGAGSLVDFLVAELSEVFGAKVALKGFDVFVD